MSEGNFIIHKEDAPGVILLDLAGRIVTEPFDMPEWAPEGISVGLLAERTRFYEQRLGPVLAAPFLNTNAINVEDIGWVAVDEDGQQVELSANEDYRMEVLAAVLEVDRDEGTIAHASTDIMLDTQPAVYTAEELGAQEQAKASAFGRQ